VSLPSLALLSVAMVLTKSNGGLISLAIGLVVWGVAKLSMLGVSKTRIVAAASLLAATVLALGWVYAQWGVGAPLMRTLEERSFFGRVHRSGDSRGAIWRELGESYESSPLGIGPGNSSLQTVAIGERQRRDSFQSKEAHSDYVGYAAERGPLGIAGLLLATWQAIALVVAARKRLKTFPLGAAAGVALWASLLGGLVAASMHSLVIEKMHFRHFWLFLAIACAFALADARVSRSGSLPARPRPAWEPAR
jgi:O-antigen ligase